MLIPAYILAMKPLIWTLVPRKLLCNTEISRDKTNDEINFNFFFPSFISSQNIDSSVTWIAKWGLVAFINQLPFFCQVNFGTI